MKELEELKMSISEVETQVGELDITLGGAIVITVEACDYSNNEIKPDLGATLSMMENYFNMKIDMINKQIDECSRLTDELENKLKVIGGY